MKHKYMDDKTKESIKAALALLESIDDYDYSAKGLVADAANNLSDALEFEEPCDHSDREDFTCLLCGADLTEEILSAAYDRAKDLRKYGE